MKALRWYGSGDVRVEQVPDPQIVNAGDAIIKVTSTAICGSDLHMFDGYIPSMEKGDILGHEFMGEVVEVGASVVKLKRGDRVVVPFTISCGNCYFCQAKLWSLCDNSNPNAHLAEALYGASASGLFGYSHIFGGYSGGQAEYVRVPYADVGPIVVPDTLRDEQVLFLSDIFPTAYQAAENCQLKGGETVAIWGCGPVGQLAIKCAYMLGAGRVIAIDHIPERLQMAATQGKAEIVNMFDGDVPAMLREMTAGRGPDAVIDAVGMEAHGTGIGMLYDQVTHAVRFQTDRPTALRQMILACRKGGIVSMPGVYGGVVDKFPLGAFFNKGLTLVGGQTHMHRYLRPLLDHIVRGDIDPSFIITHRLKLDQAPEAYKTFRDKHDGCIKVVLQP